MEQSSLAGSSNQKEMHAHGWAGRPALYVPPPGVGEGMESNLFLQLAWLARQPAALTGYCQQTLVAATSN